MEANQLRLNWRAYERALMQLISRWSEAFPSHRPWEHLHASHLLNFVCCVMNSLSSADMVSVRQRCDVSPDSIREVIWSLLVERGFAPNELRGVIMYGTTFEYSGLGSINPVLEDWTGLRRCAEALQASTEIPDCIFSDRELAKALQEDDATVDEAMAVAASRRLGANEQILHLFQEQVQRLIDARREELVLARQFHKQVG